MTTYDVKQLYDTFGKELKLELIAGEGGLQKRIVAPEVQRPGLALSGYFKGQVETRILVMGTVETKFIKELDKETLCSRLEGVLKPSVPALVVGRNYRPIKEIVRLCEKHNIALFRTPMKTMDVFNTLTVMLSEEFAEKLSLHGTLVEAFGIGLLIQGDSSVGKSEAALGLIERGHRLISDDVVKIRRKEPGYLEGTGPDLTRHLLEIRGIGIINVAHLFGAVCISERAQIDMVVRLEEWNDQHFYDRVGLEEKYTDMLGIKVPSYTLPVKPGRDIVLLIETTVLNHRLKKMGYNSAKEFNVKLLQAIASREGNFLGTTNT